MNNKVFHWIAAIILFGWPLLVHDSGITQLTLGAIGNALYLWASQKVLPTVSA